MSGPRGAYEAHQRSGDKHKLLFGIAATSFLPAWDELRPEARAALEAMYRAGLTEGANCDVASRPDDIRARGWTVAVHNDYRQDGKAYTFWLFTKGGLAIKGEGQSDAEALGQVRKEITSRMGMASSD